MPGCGCLTLQQILPVLRFSILLRLSLLCARGRGVNGSVLVAAQLEQEEEAKKGGEMPSFVRTRTFHLACSCYFWLARGARRLKE